MERNRLRRKKAKVRAFMLLACMLFFLAGVLKTYDTMLTVFGLKSNDSIFSFVNMGQTLNDVVGDLPNLKNRIKDIIADLFILLRSMLYNLKNLIHIQTIKN